MSTYREQVEAYRQRYRQALATTNGKPKSYTSTLFPVGYIRSFCAPNQTDAPPPLDTPSAPPPKQGFLSLPNPFGQKAHSPPNPSNYTNKAAPNIVPEEELPPEPYTRLHNLPMDILYLILDEMPDQPTLYSLLKAFPSLKPLWRRNYTEIHERIYEKAGLSRKKITKGTKRGQKILQVRELTRIWRGLTGEPSQR